MEGETGGLVPTPSSRHRAYVNVSGVSLRLLRMRQLAFVVAALLASIDPTHAQLCDGNVVRPAPRLRTDAPN